MRGLRTIFWLESALAVAVASLAVLTLASRAWIEGMLGIDPDRGSGALEWAVVAACWAAAITLAATARHEWRRRALAR